MNAQLDYTSWAVRQYLDQQHDAEMKSERLNAQIETELRLRETWELGATEACTDGIPMGSEAITALMAGDYHRFGEIVDHYVRNVYARSVAEDSIARQDEDAANDFLVD